MGSFAWDLLLGIFRLGTLAWDLSLDNFHSGIFIVLALERSLWIFHLRTFAWDLLLGASRLGSEFGGTADQEPRDPWEPVVETSL